MHIAIFTAQRPVVGDPQFGAGARRIARHPFAVVAADGLPAPRIDEVSELDAAKAVQQQVGRGEETDATDQADHRSQLLVVGARPYVERRRIGYTVCGRGRGGRQRPGGFNRRR